MRYTEVLRERYAALKDERERAKRGEVSNNVILSGLTEFDDKAGIDRSILTVIGAPTGEGKSIFKKHLQEHSARQGLKCLDLSFEDPPARTADRTFSTLTGVNNRKLGKGQFDDSDLVKVGLALDDAEEWADNIDYHYGLQTPEEALDIIIESDADLVQVDYAQAFPEGRRGLERTIADFAWALNSDAQEKDRATIIYSQLNADVERHGMERYERSKYRGSDGETDIGGFRPCKASDLAWSTALGQRAKGLGFLFRPGRWRRTMGENAKDDRMELIWPKVNFGGEGGVTVGFDGKTARLFNLEAKRG